METKTKKQTEQRQTLVDVKRGDEKLAPQVHLPELIERKKLSDEPGPGSEGGYDYGEGPGSGHNPEPPPSAKLQDIQDPSPDPGTEGPTGPEPPCFVNLQEHADDEKGPETGPCQPEPPQQLML